MRPLLIVAPNQSPGCNIPLRHAAASLAAAATKLTLLGQSVIKDNRAAVIVAAEVVSKAPPDGYSLLVAGGTLWITPLLQKTAYDPVIAELPIR